VKAAGALKGAHQFSLHLWQVLGTLCLASGQHSWNVYINHVEDSNLFIGGCAVAGQLHCFDCVNGSTPV